MREGTVTLVRREDYVAPAYRISNVELCFDLEPAKTLVSSKLSIERDPQAAPQPLRLHGEGLTEVIVHGTDIRSPLGIEAPVLPPGR